MKGFLGTCLPSLLLTNIISLSLNNEFLITSLEYLLTLLL